MISLTMKNFAIVLGGFIGGVFFWEFVLGSGCLLVLVFPAQSFVLAGLGLLPGGLYTPTFAITKRKKPDHLFYLKGTIYFV